MPTTIAKRLDCLELMDVVLAACKCVADVAAEQGLDVYTVQRLGDAIGQALRDLSPVVLRQPDRLSKVVVAAIRGAVERHVPAGQRLALYEALAQAFEREAASRGAVVCATE